MKEMMIVTCEYIPDIDLESETTRLDPNERFYYKSDTKNPVEFKKIDF